MVCFSPVIFGVQLTFRALALRRSRLTSNTSENSNKGSFASNLQSRFED